MKRNAITTTAIDTGWKFTPDTITLNGHAFEARKYAIGEKGDIWAFTVVEGVALKVHVGKASPVYHAAFEAAVAANAAQPAKQAEPKPAAQPKAEKPAETKPAAQPKAEKPKAKPAKAQPKAEKPAAKPAKAQPKAEKPAAKAPKAQPKAEKPAAKPAAQPKAEVPETWIGTTITGKGWSITADEATQRTMVRFEATPSAKQKAAIDAAGFYWSNTTKSWNKKLTRKAWRAAMALAETLNALK